ncbi:MAG: hypothetical protein C0490_25830 [Marivirga sp.]|nr:hypothetical protein [Marivirga sp.]
MKESITTEFVGQSISRLQENTPKIKKCLDEMSEEEIWRRPNPSCNSVGNMILHLCGNITQYIISSLGGIADNRQRDLEFSTEGGYNKIELFGKLKSTVTQATEIISKINPEEMLTRHSVQGFDLSVIGIVVHVVEHYSYHTGQIIYWTKLLKDKDMSFYANIDLNKHNSM